MENLKFCNRCKLFKDIEKNFNKVKIKLKDGSIKINNYCYCKECKNEVTKINRNKRNKNKKCNLCNLIKSNDDFDTYNKKSNRKIITRKYSACKDCRSNLPLNEKLKKKGYEKKYKNKRSVTKRIWSNFLSSVRNKLENKLSHNFILKELNYSFDEFIDNLSSKFTNNMNFENYKLNWVIGHKIKNSLLPFNSIDFNFKKFWSLENIIPVEINKKNNLEKECKKCKLSKNIENEFSIYKSKDKIYIYSMCNECRNKSLEIKKIRRKKYKKVNKLKRRKKDKSFKMRENISNAILKALKKAKTNKAGQSILKFLKYNIYELKLHIENQFDKNMNWENYGSYWHLDHIIPQSDLPYSSMEDENFKKCWSLDNLRPLEAKQNVMDGARRTRHKKK